jgi:hypothetical protein
MSNPDHIRRFEYRPCRIAAGFNVDFVMGAKTLHGTCTNVSDAGIRAEFDGSVAVGASGILILRHPSGVLQLESHVAYIEMSQVGLVFILRTSWEREVTTNFIASIANQTADPLVVRFQSNSRRP